MKYVQKSHSGLGNDEFRNLSGELEARGFRRVDVAIPPKELEPKFYYVTSYTGNEQSFEGSRKYNITYLEVGKGKLLSP
jgi:hypothetical protein